MIYYGLKWKLFFNPSGGKSDIICFNMASTFTPPKFYLGSDEIILTTKFTHLGFIWNSTDRVFLTSHAQSRINSFIGQAYSLINRGLSKFHPSTIAQILKSKLFPLLYGLEVGTFSVTQLKFRCSKVRVAHFSSIFLGWGLLL